MYSSGEVIANRYTIDQYIGESPAGHIYSALEPLNSQKLVIKVYRKEFTERYFNSSNFFLKASLLREFAHDNLCTIHDVQEDMGCVFIVREWIEGVSFEAWLNQNPPVENLYGKGLELIWQACQGLQEMHQKAKHLNIHPNNFLIGSMMAKLCDNDPRAIDNTDMTQCLPIARNYAGYRAPEVREQAFSAYPSADLYAMGALVVRLIGGQNPGETPAELQRQLSRLPREFSDFLAKAMHPKPEQRFQTAEAFSDALWALQSAVDQLPAPSTSKSARSHASVPTESYTSEPIPAAISQPQAKPTYTAPVQNTPMANDDFNFGDVEMGASFASSNELESFKSPTAFPTNTPINQPVNPPIQQPTPAAAPSENFDFYPKGGTDFYPIPTPAPNPKPIPPKMEKPKTETIDFFTQPPELPAPPKREYRQPAPPPKPKAVTLSALEEDSSFTQFGDSMSNTMLGFKGTKEGGQTLFSNEKKPQGNRKMLFIFGGIAAALLILVVVIIVMLSSQSNTKPQSVAVETEAVQPEAVAPTQPITQRPDPFPQKEPEIVAKEPVPEIKPLVKEPIENKPAPEKPALESKYKGNSKVSPEKEKTLTENFDQGIWPEMPGECIQIGNDFNDLGKTEPAHEAYAQAMMSHRISDREKVLALGGLAVTSYQLGQKEEALQTLERILTIQPDNKFAQKMKTKWK